MRDTASLAHTLALLALAGCLACGGAEETQREATAPPETEPAATPEPPAAPAPAAPEPGAPDADTLDAAKQSEYIHADPEAVTRGAGIYATYCATCHGPGGKGDGPAAAGFRPPPADHTDGAYMNALSNEHLFLVVQKGGPAVGKSPLMTAWGSVLSDDQIRDVVAYLRSLADPPYASTGS